MAQKVHLQFLFSLDRSIFISILITHATISTVTEKNIWNGIFHAYQYLKYSSYFFFFFLLTLKMQRNSFNKEQVSPVFSKITDAMKEADT